MDPLSLLPVFLLPQGVVVQFKTILRATKLSWFLIPIFSLLNLHCSTSTEPCDAVDQDRIHQSYTVSYMKNKDTTTASAQFRFGDNTGNTLELVGNCTIVHSTVTLSKNNALGLGTSYHGTKTGYQSEQQFIFTDATGKSYTNVLQLHNIELNSPPSTITKAAGATINWNGNAVGAGETVSISLATAPEADGLSVASTTVVGKTSITVAPSRLTSFSVGTKYYMRVHRDVEGGLQEQGSAKGGFEGHYVSSNSEVEITD